MTNDLELLFMGLLAIPRSSFVKFLFKFFAHFLLSCLFNCPLVKSLYIFWVGVLCQVYALWIVSSSLWLTYSCKSMLILINLKQTHSYSLGPWLQGEESLWWAYQPREGCSSKGCCARCLVILRLGVVTVHLVVLDLFRDALMCWAPGWCHGTPSPMKDKILLGSSAFAGKGGEEMPVSSRVHMNNTHSNKRPTTSTHLNHECQQHSFIRGVPTDTLCQPTFVSVPHTVQVHIHTGWREMLSVTANAGKAPKRSLHGLFFFLFN